MYIRAGLGIIGLAFTLATKNVLREQIQHRHPDLTSAQLDAATNAAALVGLVTASIFVALYLGLGLLVRRGEGWARLVTVVLAALGALGTLASLAAPAPLPTRIISLVQAALDVAIIWYLTRPASKAYFRATP